MSTLGEIALVTLGCAKNEVDSDHMRAKLLDAGYDFVDSPEEADLTIVNTCSFLAAAVEEGIDVIFDALQAKGEGMPSKVLVTGCMPSRYGDDLANELVEVAGFLAADEEDRIVEKVDELLGVVSSPSSAIVRTVDGPSAYVKISDGCNRFCSYCMIPYIRGRYRSFTAEEIRDEVAALVGGGVREIVLIGQDTGIWGYDLPESSDITELLRMLADEFEDVWFRLLYIQPEGITDELLDLMNAYDNICSYLDIPLQHVDADVLKAMNRTGSVESIRSLIAHVRERVPGVCIRTTLMAGFPGETPEQFETLLDFAGEGLFDYAGVFAYSPEEGSAACEFDGQIDDDERLSRAQRLLDVCEQGGFARAQARVGQRLEVCVEGYERTDVGIEALARFYGQAPEVDGQVHVPLGDVSELAVGERVTVLIVDSFCHELEGELG